MIKDETMLVVEIKHVMPINTFYVSTLVAKNFQTTGPIVEEIVAKIPIVPSIDNSTTNPQTNTADKTSIPIDPPPKNTNRDPPKADKGKRPMGGVKINGGSSKKDTLQDESISLVERLMKENEELEKRMKEMELMVVNTEIKRKLGFLDSTIKGFVLETQSPLEPTHHPQVLIQMTKHHLVETLLAHPHSLKIRLE